MELPENLKNEEGIEMAIEALRYANSDEYLREMVEARDKAEHDIATRIGVSKLEGIKEGKIEGKIEGKLEAAKDLLKSGMSKSKIAKLLNIDIDKF